MELAFPVRLRACAPFMKTGMPISRGWKAAAADGRPCLKGGALSLIKTLRDLVDDK